MNDVLERVPMPVVVGALGAWLIGSIWYSDLLFGRVWRGYNYPLSKGVINFPPIVFALTFASYVASAMLVDSVLYDMLAVTSYSAAVTAAAKVSVLTAVSDLSHYCFGNTSRANLPVWFIENSHNFACWLEIFAAAHYFRL